MDHDEIAPAPVGLRQRELADVDAERQLDRRFDPFDRFAELKSDRPLTELLREFDQLRAGNVATLRGWNLKAKDMDLTGEHPEFRTVTMRQLLATWVVHDLSHIAQITRTMTRSYTDAVGPWTAYFRVLQRDVRQ